MTAEIKEVKPSKNKDGLISTIPSAVVSIKYIQTLEAEIEYIELLQKEAKAKLDLEIEIASLNAGVKS